MATADLKLFIHRFTVWKSKGVPLRTITKEEWSIDTSMRTQTIVRFVRLQALQHESMFRRVHGSQPTLSPFLYCTCRHTSLSIAKSHSNFSIWFQDLARALQKAVQQYSIVFG